MSRLEFELRGESLSQEDDERSSERRPPLRGPLLLLGALVLSLYSRSQWVAVAEIAPIEDFGEQPVGESAGFQVVGVGNVGRAPLRLGSARLLSDAPGAFALEDECSGKTLASSDSCDIRVAFTPIRPGVHYARLRIEGNAANAPLETFFSGAGASPPTIPEARLEPLAADLSAPVGEAVLFEAKVANVGSSALRLFWIGLDAASTTFTVDRSACPSGELPAAGSCLIAVRFEPRSEGEHLARVLFYNDSRESPLVLNLRGEGTRSLIEEPNQDEGSVAPTGDAPTGQQPADEPVDQPPPTPTTIGPGGLRPTDVDNGVGCNLSLPLEWTPVQDDGGAVNYVVAMGRRTGPAGDRSQGRWDAVAQVPCGSDTSCDVFKTIASFRNQLRSVNPRAESVHVRPRNRAAAAAVVGTLPGQRGERGLVGEEPAWVITDDYSWSVIAVDGAAQSSSPSETRYFFCQEVIL